MKKFKYVICKTCKWVAFEVTRKYAEKEVFKFNEYYSMLSKKQQKELYGGKNSRIETYEHCFLCHGTYKNFRIAKNAELPFGSTCQPIIKRTE